MWIFEILLPSSAKVLAASWGRIGCLAGSVLRRQGRIQERHVMVCKPWVCASLPRVVELHNSPKIIGILKREGPEW